jgi:protein-tyrosine phosphatase
MIFDADPIFPGIWQGSVPPVGTLLRNEGFQLVVLCAEASEYSFRGSDAFPGVEVIHAPNQDGRRATREQLHRATQAARQVAAAVRAGKKVLVTCYMGLNRSGLVSALAIHLLTGWPGQACVRQVQRHRGQSLGNPYFVEMLGRLPGRQSATALQARS